MGFLGIAKVGMKLIPIFLVSKVNGTEISYVINVSPGFLTTVLLTMVGWFTGEGPLPFNRDLVFVFLIFVNPSK